MWCTLLGVDNGLNVAELNKESVYLVELAAYTVCLGYLDFFEVYSQAMTLCAR